MKKHLVFFALLIYSSFFLVNAYSIEIEIQKESERVRESLGWILPEKFPLQEQFQIIIDHTESKNRITVGILSTDPNDIRFPDYIENISNDPRIISFLITNQFACSPNNIDKSCVIIDVNREGLGDTIEEIRDNTREITEGVIGQGVILFAPEFDSVTLASGSTPDGEKIIVSRALYTINKQSTSSLFSAIGNIVLSADIRTAGGFYDIAETLAENNFSDFTIKLIPINDEIILRTFQISLICSDQLPEYIRCAENIDEQTNNGIISPLDFIENEEISRSDIFHDEFLPLNSIIQIVIYSDEELQIKNMNTNLIGELKNLGDIQDNGWVFSSKSGKNIDVRYIFGNDVSVEKNDLIFSIGPNIGDPIKIDDGGGCLIATAAFDSEMSSQVQLLREIRDNTVLQTSSGSGFMTGFNQFYYSFSPVVADYERENPVFKETVKITLTPLLASLTLLQYVDIDSESEMLGYGIGVILLNIGMYFVAPAVLIMKIKKLV